jgi:hypothetical protein
MPQQCLQEKDRIEDERIYKMWEQHSSKEAFLRTDRGGLCQGLTMLEGCLVIMLQSRAAARCHLAAEQPARGRMGRAGPMCGYRWSPASGQI